MLRALWLEIMYFGVLFIQFDCLPIHTLSHSHFDYCFLLDLSAYQG